MNNYQTLEQLGRDQFQAFTQTFPYIYKLKFEPYEFERTDGYFYSAYTQYVFELKKRNCNSDAWIDGYILEKSKYESIMASPIKEKLYINIFNDAIVFWYLNDLKDISWRKFSYPSNTANRGVKIEKEICYLKVSSASHKFLL